MKENRLWYAVQVDTQDDWGYGSYDESEAIEMMMSCDVFKLIAVIENGVCIEKIYKQNLIENA